MRLKSKLMAGRPGLDPIPENVYAEDVDNVMLAAARNRWVIFRNLDLDAVKAYRGEEFADAFRLILPSYSRSDMNRYYKAITINKVFWKEWTGLMTTTPGLLEDEFKSFNRCAVAARRF